MWKNTTTKVFIGFCLVILLITLSLSLMFGHILIQQRETYIFDLLSNRSRLNATEINSQLQTGKSIEEIVQGESYLILTFDGRLLSGHRHNFEANHLRSLAPTNGSLVSFCSDISQQKYLCSFVPIQQLSAWLIEVLPSQSLFEVLWNMAERILYIVLLFISVALGIAFILSRLLMAPLQRFTKAAQEIAQGNYSQVQLPTHRGDEVGCLSEAFQKMILDLQERERSLARTGLKLAHSARLASIGQMGASIAHEIKNPLTAMLGHAKLIKQDIKDSRLKESAELIWKESERCNQIIHQMLRYSRNESEENKHYRIKELLDSSLLLVKAEAEKTNVRIELDLESDEVLSGRPQQIQQVFLNLILNSIQALPRGGRLHIRSHRIGEKLCIDFEDTGPGIPKDIQAQIFEPFFTTKGKSEGTGLGLSIAQNLVEEQGGSLELVESSPGKTIFRVRLPLVLDSVQAS